MWRHRQAQLSGERAVLGQPLYAYTLVRITSTKIVDYRPQRTEGTGAPNTEDQLADDRWHTQDDEATLDMLSSRTVRYDRSKCIEAYSPVCCEQQ